MFSASMLQAAERSAVPELLTGAGADPSNKPAEPLWISLNGAMGPDHILDERVLGQYTSFLRDAARVRPRNVPLQTAALQTGDRCDAFIGEPTRCPVAPSSGSGPESGVIKADLLDDADVLDRLVARSATIIAGRVVAIKEGFLWGQPGSLMAVSGTALKGNVSSDTYLFYPFARMKTAEGTICAGQLSDRPRLSERALIFQRGKPLLTVQGSTILFVDVSESVVYAGQGGLRVPTSLQGRFSSEVTFDAILDETQRSVTRAPATR
jgi:hypothetical protein